MRATQRGSVSGAERVREEIWETEQTYVQGLQKVQELAVALKSRQDVLPEAHRRLIFPSALTMLCAVHQDFLARVAKTLALDDSAAFGEM